MTQESAAVEFKNQGNKALQAGNFNEAIEFYTKAINEDDTQPVFYGNRAQAYIKREEYGSAIKDATKAIELDPKFIKGYFRRALCYTAIIDHETALKDYQMVSQMAPQDPLAKSKLSDCRKILREIAFKKAIEVEQQPRMKDTMDLSCIKVAENYTGPKLDLQFDEEKKPIVNITKEYINEIIEYFKSGKMIPKQHAYAIISKAMDLFEKEPTMVELDNEDDELTTVCGDTHGQFFDLLNIFEKNGMPDEKHKYLFNGDFVDRGSWSCEIALTLYALKVCYPNQMFINRGNHETDSMNKVYGFEGECNHKFGSANAFKLFSESFSTLPLATLICQDYLVLHGGLFSDDDVTLEDIRKLDRFAQPQPGRAGIMMEMLWTDPQEANGRGQSPRGVGVVFGPDVTKAFCEKNGLSAIIRSHEVRMGGYSEEHDGRLITVFSAPNYCDAQGNKGCYINIGKDKVLNYNQFEAVPHPDVKPMAYASRLVS